MKITSEKILALILPKKYFWSPIKGFTMTIMAPAQKVVFKAGSSVYDFFSTIGKISDLAKENESLKEENDKLLEEKTALLEVEKENEILRQELNFQKKTSFKLVPGQVIAKDPTNIQNSFTIDVGKKAGIKEGMPVVSSGMLVGKISEVHYSTSKVMLITNPNNVVNAMLQKTRAYGLIKGELGYGLVMESIPQETKINISDMVITSGLGGNYPKGLIIGEVEEIVSKQGEIFQLATLKPILDFSSLEIVFVITGKQ